MVKDLVLNHSASVRPMIVGLALNYRDAQRTLRCVGSLLADGVSHVVIWDNSEDGGCSAGELGASLQRELRASVVISEKNLGFAAGVNRGLCWIKNKFPEAWVLLINNDAEIVRGGIASLVNALKRHGDAVIAYPGINHAGHVVGTMYYQRYLGLVTAKKLVGSFPYASGCCQLLAPERLPGAWFDESFFMYGEDVELGWRLGKSRMVFVPQTLVLHEGSASSGIGSVFYETRLVSSHWLLVFKLKKSRVDLSLLYIGKFLMLTSRAMVRSVRYNSFIPIKALFEGLRNF